MPMLTKLVTTLTEHQRYFGAERPRSGTEDQLPHWRSAYTRIVDLVDELSPNWRKRSEYVGDALHQEIADTFRRVERSEKEAALLKARNNVTQLEKDLERAREVLAKAGG